MKIPYNEDLRAHREGGVPSLVRGRRSMGRAAPHWRSGLREAGAGRGLTRAGCKRGTNWNSLEPTFMSIRTARCAAARWLSGNVTDRERILRETILAARGGLVVYADNGLTGFGNVVMLLHRDGFTTFYAHCRRVHVFAGERVERGEAIAEVGRTGFAPAPHLHFEWRQRGWPRDPVPHFRPR